MSILPYGTLDDGREVHAVSLGDPGSYRVTVLTYGATIAALHVPGRGPPDSVVLGFPSLAGYAGEHPYFGCIVGRYANRIANGRFALDGRRYRLERNDGQHALHGGPNGFHRQIWHIENCTGSELTLAHDSPANAGGYPGAVAVRVTYALEGAVLWTRFRATSDADTIINLTNHSYFNLSGDGATTILGHVLWIDAENFLPVDKTLIPTGALAPVAHTPFDFRRPRAIGAGIGGPEVQLRHGLGYDHTWVLQGGVAAEARAVAILLDPVSGRRLTVLTTQPGLQVYAGGRLDAAGPPAAYPRYAGVALETQHFPDSPHHAHFPSTVLRAGTTFTSATAWCFDTV